MKYLKHFLPILTIVTLVTSCTRVVVVERPSSGRGYGNPQGVYKKGHPHGMPPGQAKKMRRY